MKNELSPISTILQLVGSSLVLALAGYFAGLKNRAIGLNENQVLYLFSTSAQVIAALYGLTLTGYVFFRGELNQEKIEDATLLEVVEKLKSRYFVLLIFITILVVVTLILANLAISLERSESTRASLLTINLGQATFITSLFAVAYFVYDILAPDRFERASKRIQTKVDASVSVKSEENFSKFLKDYNLIEEMLQRHADYPRIASSSEERGYLRRPSNTRLAELLLSHGRIGKDLYNKLRELVTLRNSIVHGADPVVSQDIVETSSDVLRQLTEALQGEKAV